MAYLLEKRGSGLLVLKGKEYDNGHLSPFCSRELWRWPMPSSSREEEVCSGLQRCALKAADEDVLVRGRSHGLVLMANLAMVGGLPFYS